MRFIKSSTVLLLISALTTKIDAQSIADSCTIPGLHTIYFKKGSMSLNAEGKATLDSAIKIMKNYSPCKIKVTCDAGGNYQSNWDKMFL